MKPALTVLQIASGVLMTILILLQQKGVGLSAVFGGEGNFYRKRRGAEKIIFRATIVLGTAFAVSSFLISEFL